MNWSLRLAPRRADAGAICYTCSIGWTRRSRSLRTFTNRRWFFTSPGVRLCSHLEVQSRKAFANHGCGKCISSTRHSESDDSPLPQFGPVSVRVLEDSEIWW